MADRFIYSHIRRLPMFQQLNDQQLAIIADAFQVMRFEPGEVVFQQGQPARGMYMFISGQGALLRKDPDGIQRQIGLVGENQYLNEGALLRPLTETATLQILSTAVVLALPRDRLLLALSQYPEIQAALGLPVQQTIRPPQNQVFEGQRPNEQALLMTRRHWWAFGRRIWLLVLLMLLMFFLASRIEIPLLAVVFGGLGLVVPGVLMIYLILEWQNDWVIVTDQRIVRIERVILTFSTSISELPLESIQQVNAELPAADPFARLFGYGLVELRTAGNAGNVNLDFMPQPEAVQKLIVEYRQHKMVKADEQHRNAVRAEVDRLLGKEPAQPPGPPSPDTALPPTVSVQRGFSLVPMEFINAQGETVYRKHVVIWLRHVFLPGLLILAGAALFLLSLVVPSLREMGSVAYVLAFFIILVGSIWFYWSDWDWRHDIYVVGDEKITIIHKRPLWLQDEKDQFFLRLVDNVVAIQQGFFANLLNYGNVRISLVGADKGEAKVFEYVHRPRAVQEEISRRQARSRLAQQDAEEKRRRETIGEYLSVYHETINNQGRTPLSGHPAQPSQLQRPGADGNRPPNVPRVRRE